MRTALVAWAIWVAWFSTASAACLGVDLAPQLRSEDPSAYAATEVRAAAVVNGEGRFWKIEKPGLPPSWLLGTFHAGEAFDTMTAPMNDALARASRVVVEIDAEQRRAMEGRMATDPNFAFDLKSPPLSERLTAEQLAGLRQALASRGMAMEMADHMRPWLLTSLLALPVCQLQAAAQGIEAMDIVLANQAAARGVQVIGLETYEQAIGAFQRVDPSILLDALASTGRMIDMEEDLFRTNALLYERGQIAMIAELNVFLADYFDPGKNHKANNDDMMAELLDHRNTAWMEKLPGLLASGGVLVAVGALHLPGERGLVTLLRAEGFDVSRLD